MRRALFLAVTGLLAMGARTAAAQTAVADQPKVRLEVVLDRFQNDTKAGSQPFFFKLNLDQKGTLRVDAQPRNADPCDSSVSQALSTQVESTVSPLPDGRFSVMLSFAERARAGCREVGDLLIPVVSNRIVARTVTLGNSESAQITLTDFPASNESTKVTVTLTTNPQ